MKFYSEIKIELIRADIHFHYANNRGRGTNNVTITIVPPGTQRLVNSKYPENEFYEQFRVSGWKGSVNIKNEIINEYGGLKP